MAGREADLAPVGYCPVVALVGRIAAAFGCYRLVRWAASRALKLGRYAYCRLKTDRALHRGVAEEMSHRGLLPIPGRPRVDLAGVVRLRRG